MLKAVLLFGLLAQIHALSIALNNSETSFSKDTSKKATVDATLPLLAAATAFDGAFFDATVATLPLNDEAAFSVLSEHEDEDLDYIYDGRIVGGWPTTISNFPYQASLQLRGEHICGASVIASNIILTAAHCTAEPWNTGAYKVRVGSTRYRFGGQLHAVSRILRHEQYSTVTLNNDVSLLQLTSEISFSQFVQPVALADPSDSVPARKRLLVSGWGLMSESGNVASQLRYVAVGLLSRASCTKNYKHIAFVTDQMFCAGVANGGKDSCQGDSGGPLVSKQQGVTKLYGVVSWGAGCAQRGYPGVYANIAALRGWIDSSVATLRKK